MVPDLLLHDSFERSDVLLDWVFDEVLPEREGEGVSARLDRLGESGKAFWAAVSEWWDMMDKIQHAEMANVFEFFMEQWDPDCLSQECREALDTLPFGRPIRIYRGQDEGQEPGLAWTLDREKAEWFAHAGLRGMTKNDRPVVLVAEVLRVDIALASNARNESEVVPFTVPTIRETIRLY